jgi:type II secretory pathway pseudopilin PulG
MVAAGIFSIVYIALAISLQGQVKNNSTVEFKKLAAQLSSTRLDNAEENAPLEEKALAIIDEVSLSALNHSSSPNSSPDIDSANRMLADMVSHVPAVGENYRLVRLGGNPAAFAMVVNFGVGGPAAVRIYSNGGGRYALAGKIDRFEQKDFLDSDIELIPMSATEPVFVVVAGRTDDLSTGIFTAWRFDGSRAAPLWSSDLLQQSSYEADGDGFHITYCAEPDENRPAQCLKMARDTYRLQSGAWKNVETKDLGNAKPVTK